VYYSSDLWNKLLAAVVSTSGASSGATSPQRAIGTVDYANLLDDAYALAATGVAPVSRYLDLVAAFPQRWGSTTGDWDASMPQRDALELFERPALQAMGHLQALHRVTQDTACRVKLEAFLTASVLSPVLGPGRSGALGLVATRGAEGGWEVRLARAVAAGLAAAFSGQNAELALLAHASLVPFAEGRAAPHADTRAAVLTLAMRSGNLTIAARLQSHYEGTEVPAERDRALEALSASPDTNGMLVYALSGKVRLAAAGAACACTWACQWPLRLETCRHALSVVAGMRCNVRF
jgi:ERAP1-like C-terminal domain